MHACVYMPRFNVSDQEYWVEEWLEEFAHVLNHVPLARREDPLVNDLVEQTFQVLVSGLSVGEALVFRDNESTDRPLVTLSTIDPATHVVSS